MLFMAAGVMYSCSLDTLTDDLQEADLQTEQILKNTAMQNANMRIAQAAARSCEADCIDPESEIATLFPTWLREVLGQTQNR
jgi:hypothetical protein